MSKSKSICFVGGEDVHKRIQLSRHLTNNGYKITIIGTSNQTFPDYINYVNYNLVRYFSPVSDFKTIKWFQKFFNDNKFDLIHTFDTNINNFLEKKVELEGIISNNLINNIWIHNNNIFLGSESQGLTVVNMNNKETKIFDKNNGLKIISLFLY